MPTARRIEEQIRPDVRLLPLVPGVLEAVIKTIPIRIYHVPSALVSRIGRIHREEGVGGLVAWPRALLGIAATEKSHEVRSDNCDGYS